MFHSISIYLFTESYFEEDTCGQQIPDIRYNIYIGYI